MNDQDFTQDDVMQPVYCTSCKKHISRAYSDLTRGLCSSCATASQTVSAPPIQPQPKKPFSFKSLFFGSLVNTSRLVGPCQSCGCVNCLYKNKHKPGAYEVCGAIAAGCLIVGFFTCGATWVIAAVCLVAMLFLPREIVYTIKRCPECNAVEKLMPI
jgi:hypothetical protein